MYSIPLGCESRLHSLRVAVMRLISQHNLSETRYDYQYHKFRRNYSGFRRIIADNVDL